MFSPDHVFYYKSACTQQVLRRRSGDLVEKARTPADASLSPPLKTSLHKPLIAPQEVAENQLLIEHISAIPHQLWISLGGLW